VKRLSHVPGDLFGVKNHRQAVPDLPLLLSLVHQHSAHTEITDVTTSVIF
jgi:hypothetical protein